jgi:hypothetical protein
MLGSTHPISRASSRKWCTRLTDEDGLAESTRDARTGLIESLFRDNGERSFATLTRRVLREELNAHAGSSRQSVVGASPHDRLDDRGGAHRAG